MWGKIARRQSLQGAKCPAFLTTMVVRSFACCRIGRTDGWQIWRMGTAAHKWNWHSNHPRIIRRANRKLTNVSLNTNISCERWAAKHVFSLVVLLAKFLYFFSVEICVFMYKKGQFTSNSKMFLQMPTFLRKELHNSTLSSPPPIEKGLPKFTISPIMGQS